MSAITDWIGEPEYPAATADLEAIVNHMENPTYAQVIEVLRCMQDLAEEYCVFSDQSSAKTGYTIKSPRCGRDKNGVFHCVCGDCEPFHEDVGQLNTFELDVQKGTCFVNGINVAKHTSALKLEFENGEWSLHITTEYAASSVSARAKLQEKKRLRRIFREALAAFIISFVASLVVYCVVFQQ